MRMSAKGAGELIATARSLARINDVPWILSEDAPLEQQTIYAIGMLQGYADFQLSQLASGTLSA